MEHPSVRAKFYVRSVECFASPTDAGTVKMCPVTSGSEENKSFWSATPSGELTMYISNPAAFKQFRPGQEYYLDFTLAKE